MEQSTPEKTLTAEEVYQTLRSEILTLRIRPGEMLPENMLVSRFGLSRTPIRSIIVRLSQEGLIVQQGRKGNYVSLIDLDMAEQMIFLRLQLEIAAFSHLIRHSDTMLLVHLRENLDEQLRVSTSSEPVEHFYQVDSAFHGMCMEAAGRLRAWQTLQNMEVHYSRYRRLDYKVFQNAHVFESLYEDHVSLYDILRHRDLEAVPDMLARHLYSGMIRIDEDLYLDLSNYFESDVRPLKQILRDIHQTLSEICKA